MSSMRWSLLILSAVLAGCAGSKRYVEPAASGETAQCLLQCEEIRSDCRQEALEEHQKCEALFNYHYREWRACVYQRGERACASLKPFGCSAPRYGTCTGHYDRCFVGCGGRIE